MSAAVGGKECELSAFGVEGMRWIYPRPSGGTLKDVCVKRRSFAQAVLSEAMDRRVDAERALDPNSGQIPACGGRNDRGVRGCERR